MAADTGQAATPLAHWRRVLAATAVLLGVWAAAGLLLPWSVGRLHAFGWVVAGFPVAYWMTAQGALLAFLAVVAAYALWMERLDARYRREAQASGADHDEPPHG